MSVLENELKEVVSEGIRQNLLCKSGDVVKANYYYVEEAEAEQLVELAAEFCKMVEPIFLNAWNLVVAEYEKTVPKHLHWQMGNFLSNALNSFVTCSLYEGLKNKTLSDPNVEGREWLSMFVIL